MSFEQWAAFMKEKGHIKRLLMWTAARSPLWFPARQPLPCLIVVNIRQLLKRRSFVGSGTVEQLPKARTIAKNQALKVRVFVNREQQSRTPAVFRYDYRAGLRQSFNYFAEVVLHFS
jgi:hypothetical protein